jgi:hypothetical protein
VGISTQISGMITFLFKKKQSVADGWWLCADRNPKSSYWNVSALLTDSLAESLTKGEFAESENDHEKVTIGGPEKPYVNDTVEIEDIVLADDGSGGGMYIEALDTPDETAVSEEIGKLGEIESSIGKGGRIVFEDDDTDTDDDNGNDIDVRSNFFEEVRC